MWVEGIEEMADKCQRSFRFIHSASIKPIIKNKFNF